MPPFALTDRQLHLLLTAAASLDVDKRHTLLQRVAAALRLNGVFRPSDADIDRALASGLRGL